MFAQSLNEWMDGTGAGEPIASRRPFGEENAADGAKLRKEKRGRAKQTSLKYERFEAHTHTSRERARYDAHMLERR